MRTRWEVLLLPSLAVSFLLFAIPQAVFLRMSFFEDLGLGRMGGQPDPINYLRFFRDSFYLQSFWLTTYLSSVVMGLSLVVGFPAAYVLARMRARWALGLLAVIVMSSFVTVVIKAFGLIVLFSANGPVNRVLMALGVLESPVQILGNRVGVVIGLLHYAIPFTVLLLFGVIQGIPRSLEEAAQIHGAGRFRVLWRVIMPLSLPGVLAAALTVFNMSMGAFASAALLGGGRVLTLPVLIQRTVILETRYGMGGAISAVLLVSVFVINVASVALLSRLRTVRWLAT